MTCVCCVFVTILLPPYDSTQNPNRPWDLADFYFKPQEISGLGFWNVI